MWLLKFLTDKESGISDAEIEICKILLGNQEDKSKKFQNISKLIFNETNKTKSSLPSVGYFYNNI